MHISIISGIGLHVLDNTTPHCSLNWFYNSCWDGRVTVEPLWRCLLLWVTLWVPYTLYSRLWKTWTISNYNLHHILKHHTDLDIVEGDSLLYQHVSVHLLCFCSWCEGKGLDLNITCSIMKNHWEYGSMVKGGSITTDLLRSASGESLTISQPGNRHFIWCVQRNEVVGMSKMRWLY